LCFGPRYSAIVKKKNSSTSFLIKSSQIQTTHFLPAFAGAKLTMQAGLINAVVKITLEPLGHNVTEKLRCRTIIGQDIVCSITHNTIEKILIAKGRDSRKNWFWPRAVKLHIQRKTMVVPPNKTVIFT